MRLFRDTRGASAAEYALIVAIIGAPLAIAALVFGDRIGNVMPNTSRVYGPGGTIYTCTANCQYEDLNYCSAHRPQPGEPGPVFSPALPALPANGTCPL